MKIKLLIENFNKFIKENLQREKYDDALGVVFAALEDLDKPPYSYDLYGNVEEIEINGKSYPIRGKFSLTKSNPLSGNYPGGRKDFYRISGRYDYEIMSIVFNIKHLKHIPRKIMSSDGVPRLNPEREKGRSITTHPIPDLVLDTSSVDEAMGLVELIRLDYKGLKELFG